MGYWYTDCLGIISCYHFLRLCVIRAAWVRNKDIKVLRIPTTLTDRDENMHKIY
jgi:hypothetical protein